VPRVHAREQPAGRPRIRAAGGLRGEGAHLPAAVRDRAGASVHAPVGGAADRLGVALCAPRPIGAGPRKAVEQAEYMVSAARDSILAAACRRHGVPAAEGRGMDQLPDAVTDPLRDALVARLGPDELVRAFGVVIDRLIDEIRQTDAVLAGRLEPALSALFSSARAATASHTDPR